jgi:hypothetical protein
MRKRRSRDTDPMREVDLLLLEDAMMRPNIATNRTAVVAQTACMTVVALFLFAAFLYALAHRQTVVAATSGLGLRPAGGPLPGQATHPRP